MCTLCPVNTVCLSGTLSNCMGNASSAAGTSSKCTCNPGFYSVVSGVLPCVQCAPGKYCAGDTSSVGCTANSYSPLQSSSNTSCTCNAGFVVSFYTLNITHYTFIVWLPHFDNTVYTCRRDRTTAPAHNAHRAIGAPMASLRSASQTPTAKWAARAP